MLGAVRPRETPEGSGTHCPVTGLRGGHRAHQAHRRGGWATSEEELPRARERVAGPRRPGPSRGPIAVITARHRKWARMTGDERPYLVGLGLTGRRVVVVGGGTVAQRRLPALLAAGADVEVVAPEVTPAVEGMATAKELRWTARPYRDGDLDGAWYALAATDDRQVNAAVAAAAERARVFCVRADDAPGGSAVTPAVGEHDGLTVGVLSGGRPRRSAAVRTALIEALQAGVVRGGPGRRARAARRRAGRRWPRRPGADHGARPAAAGPRGRRRHRPARTPRPARRARHRTSRSSTRRRSRTGGR